MVFSHSFFAASVINTIYDQNRLDKLSVKKDLFYFWGIVGAIFPDFDIALYLLDRNIQHRQLLSHSIIPYLLILLVTYLVYKTTKKKFVFELTSVFVIGVSTHIFLDMLVGGLVLLAPFINSIIGIPIYFTASNETWGTTYMTSVYMLFEILFFLFYLNVISKNKNLVITYLPLLFFFVSAIMFVIVL